MTLVQAKVFEGGYTRNLNRKKKKLIDDFLQIQDLQSLKDTITRVKKWAADEKIAAIQISNNRLISRI